MLCELSRSERDRHKQLVIEIPMPTLFAKLLGRMDFVDSDGVDLGPMSRKTRALLAYLIVENDRWHGRERLASLLWGDRGDAQARNSLNQSLYELRKIERALNVPLTERDSARVRLARQEVAADLFSVEDQLAIDPIAAADLYAGDLLDGFDLTEPAFAEWLGERRAYYRDRVVKALASFVLDGDGPADSGQKLEACRRLLAIDPLNEPIRRALIRLSAAAGDRSEAIRQYQICEALLKSELGVAPEQETMALIEAIKTQPQDSKTTQSTPEHDRDRDQNGMHSVASGAAPTVVSAILPGVSDNTRDFHSLRPELPQKPSVAVLPFENMSRDPEQEYFADGMTEDIITALSRFEGLFVIARNSTFTFKGHSIDVADVSQALGVRYVIEGSVRTAGNKVRVTAQLIDASNGNHIWAHRYDRELEDIFAVQDEITEAIVAAIAPEIDEAERRLAQRKPPESLDIWGRYQQALTAYYLTTSEGFEAAIRQFDKINALAPGFAPAFATGADARYRYALHFEGDRAKLHQEAAAKAQIAIGLDSLNPECVISFARMYSYQGLHDIAVAKAEEAVALNPNAAMSVYCLGYFLFRACRFAEAIANIDQAIRLSPRDVFSHGFYGIRTFSAFCLGRYEEAAHWAVRTSSCPNPRPRFSYWVVTTLVKVGRLTEATALMQDLQRQHPEETLTTYREHLLAALPQVSESFDIVIDALREAGMQE